MKGTSMTTIEQNMQTADRIRGETRADIAARNAIMMADDLGNDPEYIELMIGSYDNGHGRQCDLWLCLACDIHAAWSHGFIVSNCGADPIDGKHIGSAKASKLMDLCQPIA